MDLALHERRSQARPGGVVATCLDSMCVLLQTWDVNKAAPESLGGPFNLMLASNAVHTCDNMAGRSLSVSQLSYH